MSASSTMSQKPQSIDAATKELIVGQIKLFMFSGHDTTSASVCYSFYMFSKSLEDLDRIRAEHDEVFGTSLDRAPSMISEDSHVLNQLPFTLAVIKETLRLFPIASSTRLGKTGFSVVAEDGRVSPTEECLVWSSPDTIQRSPDLWSRPDNFIPDRWLVQSGHQFYPVKCAWRPFEFGPRNCIGQEHALLGMKFGAHSFQYGHMSSGISSILASYQGMCLAKELTKPLTVGRARGCLTVSSFAIIEHAYILLGGAVRSPKSESCI
ncbi:MAG: hypothetical protein Q9166_007851 [cf. Caloplaca sp. 2 TL-2023]